MSIWELYSTELEAGPVVKVGEVLPDCEICDFLKDSEMGLNTSDCFCFCTLDFLALALLPFCL